VAAIGLVLGSALGPARTLELARAGERLGFDELWLSEDYFSTGAVSAAGAVLAATERVPVGLGVVPVLTRHPALLAMELATLEGMFPGRLRAGVGLGVPDWLRQMGLAPRSSLAAMRECLTALRRLLAGEEVSARGELFRLERIRLEHPVAMPLYAGAIGPHMLELAGELADGVVLSTLAGATYVRWATSRIAAGAGAARRRVVTFAMFSDDRAAVRRATAFYLALDPRSALTDVYGWTDELVELARGGTASVERALPDEWLDELAIAGDADECAARIRRLAAAGSDAVALFPLPVDRAGEVVEFAAREVRARL